MPLSLSDWDIHVAPKLRRIEDGGHLIQSGARMIHEEITKLTQLPDFTTKAEAEVVEARDKLVAALQVMDAAILAFGQKGRAG